MDTQPPSKRKPFSSSLDQSKSSTTPEHRYRDFEAAINRLSDQLEQLRRELRREMQALDERIRPIEACLRKPVTLPNLPKIGSEAIYKGVS
jgi:hypothetical protein